MTQRQLDLALLGGIGVLLLVILILALSSAPTLQAGDISDPAASAAEPAEAEAELAETASAEEPAEPLPPAPTETEGEPAAGEAGNETGVFGTDLAAGTVEDAPTAGTTPGTPPGTTEVERIGFAYATGSEGACGVPLTAWSFVAVSRDLLTAYPCGTAVTLTLDDEIAGRREVIAQVGDTMGADIANTVNIFVGEGEPALEYGVTQGSLSP